MADIKTPMKINRSYRNYKCKHCGSVFHTDTKYSNCIKCGKKYPVSPTEESANIPEVTE